MFASDEESTTKEPLETWEKVTNIKSIEMKYLEK